MTTRVGHRRGHDAVQGHRCRVGPPLSERGGGMAVDLRASET